MVDGDPAARKAMCRVLQDAGYTAFPLDTPANAPAAALAHRPGVIVVGMEPDPDKALELAERLATRWVAIPVVMTTCQPSLERALAAMRAGAFDLVVDPLHEAGLVFAVERATAHRALRLKVRRLEAQLDGSPPLENLLGASPPMRDLLRLIERVAPVASSVLITGESGTGKELVARAIHARSPRRDRPFIALNCAAVPDALLEAELFGHLRGAFTDARTNRRGLLAKAHGGTLFLDEIGEMPAGLQVKLLRFLQERTFRPVGSDDEVAVDVRVLAATHRDLDAMVDAEEFRKDLLYRLDVLRLEIRPLRDRGADVLLLAERFLTFQAEQTNSAVESWEPEVGRMLMDWTWPGNVRELQNCIERAVVLCEGDRIRPEDLPTRIRKYRPTTHVIAVADDPSAMLSLEEVERRYTLQVLETVGGNKALAARALQVDRKTLYRKLARWGITEKA